MPLTTPPQVQIGADTTWHALVEDEDLTAAEVALGPRRMSARDVQYLRWTASLDGEAPQVFKLLVAGPSAGTVPGAVVVPVGRHATRARITDTPEVIERATEPLEVTA